MKTTVLDQQASIANELLRQIRDKDYQQNRALFRKNMEKCGTLLAYELSKELEYLSKEVPTVLGSKSIMLPKEEVVLTCILRASLPFYQGFLDLFESADSIFIGAYRASESAEGVEINLDYVAASSVQDKVLIMIDPMLATGNSMVSAIQTTLKYGRPKKIFICSLIATPDGIEQIDRADFDGVETEVFSCSIDEILNEDFYIVPGLGDAGDLSYGAKL
jgi:uracil phosphoribosyltransferase